MWQIQHEITIFSLVLVLGPTLQLALGATATLKIVTFWVAFRGAQWKKQLPT
jgi:hypothetical protein